MVFFVFHGPGIIFIPGKPPIVHEWLLPDQFGVGVGEGGVGVGVGGVEGGVEGLGVGVGRELFSSSFFWIFCKFSNICIRLLTACILSHHSCVICSAHASKSIGWERI